jgi:hypothetical protein
VSFQSLINVNGLRKNNLEEKKKEEQPFYPIIKKEDKVKGKSSLMPMNFKSLDHSNVKVRLHKKDEKIVSIEFVCSCGESATVNVDYEEQIH